MQSMMMRNLKISENKAIWGIGIPVVCVFVFLSFCSNTTSFLYHDVENLDSDFYQSIGRAWSKGFLPYVDVWDQKGPLIYLINAIGYWMTDSKIGVFILQFINHSIVFVIAFRFLRKRFPFRTSVLLLLLSFLSLINDYSIVGNNVEEYLLPWLMFSFVGLYAWTSDVCDSTKIITHPPRYTFFYGVVFIFSVFTRMTNAIGLCGGVAVVAFYLIYNRQWKNLMWNVVCFLLGVLIIFIPITVYFYYKDALDEMWYATLFYNMEYAKIAPKLDPFSFNQRIYLIKSAINALTLIAVSILCLLTNRRFHGLMWGFVTFCSLLWLMSGNGFNHYFIITFPYFFIIVSEIKALSETLYNNLTGWELNIFLKPIACLFVLVTIVCSLYELSFIPSSLSARNDNLTFYNEVAKDIKDGGSFVAYNVSPYIYIYTGKLPDCRFFAYQDAQISFSTTLRGRVRKAFETKLPCWILVNGNARNISDILERYYNVEKRYTGGYSLYRQTLSGKVK